MNETVSLKNEHAEVERFQRLFEELLRGEGFSEDLIHDLVLVSEELLVNTINYGYPSTEVTGIIEVDILVDTSRIVSLTFRDDGQAFDPLAAEERDPNDERVGGWGLPMIKALTDKLSYRREGNHNIIAIERAERDS